MSLTLTPAAQYLRMSTEHQQYSLDSQAAAIQQYAEEHGFTVTCSYVDAGKSGLVLKHREALGQLLKDVVGGPPEYKAVLVYDVSRWGRFQDIDEAAYYEVLCKRGGIQVHYCAETFNNEATMPNVVMKALKRVMAAEYSRDLSEKVFQGEKRINELGYRTGGKAGYGLRRMLCSLDGTPKQLLQQGEHKSIITDRVTLVLGPAEEVACVREIYKMVIDGQRTLRQIADDLNRRRVRYFDRPWTISGVRDIVENPKYMGCNVWGRKAKKLGGPSISRPEESWTKKPLAFPPLVSEETFFAAREALRRSWTDDELLSVLRSLLKEQGRLSRQLIHAHGGPYETTYTKRFGSLGKAYELIGYSGRTKPVLKEVIRRRRMLRESLIQRLVALFPRRISVEQPTLQHRPKLLLKNGPVVYVLSCQPAITRRNQSRWLLPTRIVRNAVTLLCRCAADSNSFHDLHLLPRIERGRLALREHDPFLKSGKRLRNLRLFVDMAQMMRNRANVKRECPRPSNLTCSSQP
jgi:DNA invertase Pin-like site-specific DNA recombinase